jgi:predicted nucleotidyltransferase
MVRELEDLLAALERNKVRYLLVGGLAVMFYGVRRTTADIDLIIDFTEENVANCVKALSESGYNPQPPIPLKDFISVANRSRFKEDMNMLVYGYAPTGKAMNLDVLLDIPLDFELMWKNRVERDYQGSTLKLISTDDLIRLKEYSGRPQDIEDIKNLLGLK